MACNRCSIGGLAGAASVANAQESLQALSQDPKQWPMALHDYANTRFSALNQINTKNVGQLTLTWSFSVGTDGT